MNVEWITILLLPLSRADKDEGISVLGASVVFLISALCNGEPVKRIN